MITEKPYVGSIIPTWVGGKLNKTGVSVWEIEEHGVYSFNRDDESIEVIESYSVQLQAPGLFLNLIKKRIDNVILGSEEANSICIGDKVKVSFYPIGSFVVEDISTIAGEVWVKVYGEIQYFKLKDIGLANCLDVDGQEHWFKRK